MNTYDKHQLTAREIYRGEEPPAVLWLCAAMIGFVVAFFLAAAVAFNF